MANVRKADRVQDSDIRRLNHVGLGLKSIAEILGCHPATITLRLDALGVSPTDTRRSFMEGVYKSLDPDIQEWLTHNLYNSGLGVKEFVATLIRREYEANPGTTQAAPTPVPELEGGEILAVAPPSVAPERLEDVPEAPVTVPKTKKRIKFA